MTNTNPSTRGQQAFLTVARLSLKVNRFEVIACGLGALGIAFLAMAYYASLHAIGASPDCLLRWIASVPTSPACDLAVAQWAETIDSGGAQVMAAMVAVPLVIGLLVGIPVVAREIESGTAAVAWALAGSRRRWLALQFVPAAVLVVALLVIPAVTATLLAETRSAGGVWSSPLDDADLRGMPVIFRGVAVFSIAVLAGTLVGRILPALILGSVLTGLLVLGLAVAKSEAVDTSYELNAVGAPGSVGAFLTAHPDIEVRFVDDAGDIATLQEVLASVPKGTSNPFDWIQARYRFVPLGASAAVATKWQTLQCLILILVTAGAVLAAFLAVDRRRPS